MEKLQKFTALLTLLTCCAGMQSCCQKNDSTLAYRGGGDYRGGGERGGGEYRGGEGEYHGNYQREGNYQGQYQRREPEQPQQQQPQQSSGGGYGRGAAYEAGKNEGENQDGGGETYVVPEDDYYEGTPGYPAPQGQQGYLSENEDVSEGGEMQQEMENRRQNRNPRQGEMQQEMQNRRQNRNPRQGEMQQEMQHRRQTRQG